MTIGKAIAQCRSRKGITTNELAIKAGVHYQTIYLWETDKATPRVDLLIYVAEVLGVTLDELVGRTVAK